jgi:hypothetical protein
MSDGETIQAQAAELNRVTVSLIERILAKYTAAVLEEMRAQIQRRDARIAELEVRVTTVQEEHLEDALSLERCLKTIRYLVGIGEKGRGRPMRECETAEQFLLHYVQEVELRAAALGEALNEERERSAVAPSTTLRGATTSGGSCMMPRGWKREEGT